MNNLNIKKNFNISDYVNLDKYSSNTKLKQKIEKFFSIFWCIGKISIPKS